MEYPMKAAVLAAFFLISGQAFAMPCDTGYLCTSSSGKYQIEIRRCRYDNRLGAIQKLKIDGKDAGDAKLGAAFDGEDFGGFEIDLGGEDDNKRILSVEWGQKTGQGTIRDKSRNYNPAPYITNVSEAIVCKEEG
jgi:hypothetical protein